MEMTMKLLVPVALGGVVFLLTSCSSGGSSSSTSTTSTSTSTTTTTSSADDAKSDTSDASKDDATKTDSSSEKSDSDKSDSDKTDKPEKADASAGETDAPGTARNLYVEQLKKPDSKMNTGIVYWLELNRDGKKTHVTNKTAFQEGDQLRIHVKPNIDCYSYVLEIAGSSKGDKQVLFPSEDLPDNKLKAGKEVILPVAKGGDEAWLKFDDHPGTEVVRIVVSRKKLDPAKELPGGESSTVTIASSRDIDGADSIPDGSIATIVTSDDSTKGSKNLTVVTKSKKSDDEGKTTVVSKSGEKSLRVDIAMDHREAKSE
jgi:hypothetical protein